jgi:hypothetical protein
LSQMTVMSFTFASLQLRLRTSARKLYKLTRTPNICTVPQITEAGYSTVFVYTATCVWHNGRVSLHYTDICSTWAHSNQFWCTPTLYRVFWCTPTLYRVLYIHKCIYKCINEFYETTLPSRLRGFLS